MPRSGDVPLADGLGGLRRGGAATELLFLYECTTLEPTQLRPIAERLGVTVQAVSNVYRSLRRRGLIELRAGRYRPTVEGVAWLHEGLGRIADDVRDRLANLHVVRSTRARAEVAIPAGSPVSLELVDGLLSARLGGAGPSHGIARSAARPGGLVEVGQLEGIVPIEPAEIRVIVLREEDLEDPDSPSRIRAALPAAPGVAAAEGLEAYLLVRRASAGPMVRFAVGPTAAEAARLGVPSTVFVLDRDLGRLLAGWGGPRPPSVDVRSLRAVRAGARSSGGRPESRHQFERREKDRRAPRT